MAATDPQAKRKDDPENENHRGERRFDWRELAPRWLLVTSIAALLALSGYLWGRNAALYDDRLELMAKYQSDERWKLLSELAYTQGVQGETIRHHTAQLQQLTKAADDISEIRADLRVLKRIAEQRGGS
jgi:hypothetical protein